MRVCASMLLVVGLAALLPLAARSQPASKYLHPAGADCVQPTEGPQSSKRFHRFYFKNICGRSFGLHLVSSRGKTLKTNGIGPGSPSKPAISNLMCEIPTGECRGTSWEVH